MRRVGVALSGGGHRATVWALGVLLYLVDAGRNEQVTTITSVSGGSIANGVVASKGEFGEMDPADFRAAVAPTLHHIADEGLFFFGRPTNGYVYGVLGAAILSVLSAAAAIALLALGEPAAGLLVAVACVVLVTGTAIAFSRRSLVADRAMGDVHFTADGRPLLLREVDRRTTHVFCATELQAGNQVYFSPRFAYCYRLGIGEAGDLPLSTAVQASACLPGAFAPRRLPTARHHFRRVAGVSEPEQLPTEIVANDGGVYDNMGDEWFLGYADRAEAWPELPDVAPPVDQLIVANASGGWGWQPLRKRYLLRREIEGISRSAGVLYNLSTRMRRRELIDRWRAGHDEKGALVHIPQSPFVTADGFAGHEGEAAARARAVIAALGDDEVTRGAWEDTAKHNAAIKTVLRALGRADTLSLLRHAYVLAMANLHVTLDYPLLAVPTDDELADWWRPDDRS